MDSLMLRQLVTEPTRESTTLDLVLIKSTQQTDDVLVDESFEKPIPISDQLNQPGFAVELQQRMRGDQKLTVLQTVTTTTYRI